MARVEDGTSYVQKSQHQANLWWQRLPGARRVSYHGLVLRVTLGDRCDRLGLVRQPGGVSCRLDGTCRLVAYCGTYTTLWTLC